MVNMKDALMMFHSRKRKSRESSPDPQIPRLSDSARESLLAPGATNLEDRDRSERSQEPFWLSKMVIENVISNKNVYCNLIVIQKIRKMPWDGMMACV